jgi:hypothetical protein
MIDSDHFINISLSWSFGPYSMFHLQFICTQQTSYDQYGSMWKFGLLKSFYLEQKVFIGKKSYRKYVQRLISTSWLQQMCHSIKVQMYVGAVSFVEKCLANRIFCDWWAEPTFVDLWTYRVRLFFSYAEFSSVCCHLPSYLYSQLQQQWDRSHTVEWRLLVHLQDLHYISLYRIWDL